MLFFYDVMNDQTFIQRLNKVFCDLNEFIEEYNSKVFSEGGIRIEKQTVKIVGQAALLCVDLPFPVIATMDLDTISTLPHLVNKKLDALLSEQGLRLEPQGHLIWMPEQTEYKVLFDFEWATVQIADPQSVILSKYKFNRLKDRRLIESYRRFFPAVEAMMKKIRREKPF